MSVAAFLFLQKSWEKFGGMGNSLYICGEFNYEQPCET